MFGRLFSKSKGSSGTSEGGGDEAPAKKVHGIRCANWLSGY